MLGDFDEHVPDDTGDRTGTGIDDLDELRRRRAQKLRQCRRGTQRRDRTLAALAK
jgi:hypothetical protein